MTPTLDPSRRKRDTLRSAFSGFQDMRPGSLRERRVKCGKPGCRCQEKDAPGHGPFWLLTSKRNGKTVTRSIPVEIVETTRRQIQEFRRFRQTVQEYIRINEQLCETQLLERKAPSLGSDEKKGSKRASSKRSARNSTRS